MKWQGRRGSRNIQDRRGMPGGRAGAGGLGLILVVVVGAFLGLDLTPLMQGGGVGTAPEPTGPNSIDDRTEEFVSVVLAYTEEVWCVVFKNSGLSYAEPTLVLYSAFTSSAFVTANAAVWTLY